MIINIINIIKMFKKILLVQFTLLFILYCQQTDCINSNSVNPIPNINYFVTGIDIKYGAPYNVSVRNPIFERFSYNNNITEIINDVTYDCPDQIYWISYSSIDKKSTVQVYYSVEEIESDMFESFTTGFDCERINGMFSLSEQVDEFNLAYDTQESYTALTFLTVTVSKAELNAEIKLNENFKTIVNSLPTVYSQETCKYFVDFIKLFGTSYAYRAVFGGYVTMSTYFKTSTTYDKTESEIEFEIGTQFLMFTTNSSFDFNQTKIYQNLDATYNSTLQVYGGSPNYFQSNNYQSWIATVSTNPIFVRADIISISKLLYGLPQQNALNDAINDYLENGEIYMSC